MPDLRKQLRWYYESVVRPRRPEDVVAGIVTAAPAETGTAPDARRSWQRPVVVALGAAAAALALIGGTALLTLQFAGNEPAGPTVPVTTTATTTTAATTTQDPPSAEGLDTLAAFQAGPVPPAATCPAGSTPDTPGVATDPRPFGVPVAVAFDRESGLLVLTGSGHSMWTFDPCRNRWAENGSDGWGASGWMAYDADSDLMVLVGPRSDAADRNNERAVWSYDTNTDTWVEKAAPPAAVDTFSPLLYHDPSGLVLARGNFGQTLWGYDVEADTWHELGLLGPGFLAYDPGRDGFYLDRPGDDPRGWWYEAGRGWAPLGIPADQVPFTAALAGNRVVFDPTTGRIVTFSAGMAATLDPSAPGWEVLEGSSGGSVAAAVYDSANARLIAFGGGERADDGWVAGEVMTGLWAVDTRTAAWTELLPPPEVGIVETPLQEGDFTSAYNLAAVSATEAWLTNGIDLIGHVVDGSWTWYRLTDQGYVLRLAVAPDGTVWAATELGLFSFDGAAWARRSEDAASALIAGGDGAVWIGGYAGCRAWLARWDGASWARFDPPEGACDGSGGVLPLAVTPDGEVWLAREPGWIPHGLVQYDGTTWEEILVEGTNLSIWDLEATPDGDVWALGEEWDSGRRVLTHYDGTAWTVYEWPYPEGAFDIEVSPDGTVWLRSETSLRSFDGTAWTIHVEGTEITGLAIAPDGTVWYGDESGAHILGG